MMYIRFPFLREIYKYHRRFYECRRNIYLKKCFFFAVKPAERGNLNAVNLELLKPELVLGENNRKSFVQRFKGFKARSSDKSTSLAAVLIPLCIHEGELGFLYTLRSTKLNSNRGQVSFPGGMHDKEDKNLEETALRETWEELHIPREKIQVWTSGNLIDKKNLRVMPVFGFIGEVEPQSLKINKDEVEEAFFLSLKNLCDLSLCRYTQFRGNYTLPVYFGGKHRIWGFTAMITHVALNALVPDAYNHKLVHVRPILPDIKGNLKKDIRSS